MADGTVSANGVRIWYEDFGDPADPDVILLVGANATAISWDRSFYDPIVAAGYHVVRFDNRDVGLSQWFDFVSEPYTLEDMAEDTVGLMDALSIERAHLVGASLGGMIAQLVALQYPDRVLSMTSICSTPGVSDPDLPPMPDEIVMLAMTPVPESRAERVEHLVGFYRALAGSRTPFDEDYWRSVFEADMDRGFNPLPAHGLVAAAAPSRRGALEHLDLPVLVIHGDSDPILQYEHGVATAKAVPGARLVTIAGGGHIDVLAPVDEVVPPILDLLASTS
jgi:pimeloyl-ACP methyl ester carboxylesterase